MDSQEEVKRKTNPRAKANILSIWMFLYVLPVFRKAYKRGLTEDDLYAPLDEHRSSKLGDKLDRIWRQEYRKHKKSALHRALFRMFGIEFMLLGLVKGIHEMILVFLLPISLQKLVTYFRVGQTEISLEEVYIYAGLIILSFSTECILSHPSMMGIMHIAMKLRVSCSAMIYRKTLKLTRTSLGQTTVGQLVNLLSNDVSKFDQGFALAHFLWIGPLQTATGTYLIFRQIGVAAFAGIAFLLLFIPIQIFGGKKTSDFRLKTALRTDERVRLMNEIISGIQVIKMYTWEKPFAKLISMVRKTEIAAIRKRFYLFGILFSLEQFVTRTSLFISILIYITMGNDITAEKVFAVSAVYSVMRPIITILFSSSISSIAEVHVSMNRIHKFLCYEELPEETFAINEKSVINEDISNKKINSKSSYVKLEHLNAKWLPESKENTLHDINLYITDDKLISVIGPVGSGKTSILNVILKELPTLSGRLDINGKISFASQEPWLFSGSVRQNILFGDTYDEDRYLNVIRVCALESDLTILPYGDRTMVGERGKALSGGQKARVNLARCIYKEADIYLLDDPLSAVDAKVGKQLYDKCIKKHLKGKIRILITHQLQYLSNSDHIVILKDGSIEQQGTYNELQNSGLDFANLLKEFHNEDDNETVKQRLISVSEEVEYEQEAPSNDKEFMETGKVKMSVYKTYIRYGGSIFSIAFLAALFVLSQAVGNGVDYFVSYWVNLEQDLASSNGTVAPVIREQIIYTYSALILVLIILAIWHCIYYFQFMMKASIKIHDTIFVKVSKALMKFFNTNTSGRILNRFSKDLGTIDEYIPVLLFDVLEVGLQLFGALALSIVIDQWLVIPSVVLLVLFYFMRILFLKTTRAVKRLESVYRSPIFGQVTASINGLSTIRAFNAQQILIKEFDKYQDQHSSAWHLFLASTRCFGFWSEFICVVFYSVIIISLLSLNRISHGGDFGLLITQYISLMGALQYGVRQWTELENQMTSVERIQEYTKLDMEPERSESQLPSKSWPEFGKIVFDDVCLRYNPTEENVLKNLNFTIEAGEKVGIVGRTGAGKSSIITALFQLYEIRGNIIIDYVDTTRIPLDALRAKISIIPQEPVLFSGTMRKNLDPFDEYSDDILWGALGQVELKEVVAELPAGLNSNVSEGGTNFSVGQRQLVCLARAIIKKNKILVLDEATANVDPHTDGLIQKTIRRNFADFTVLTIAHRLHTVMDSDKILVMSSGNLVEFDHPHVLLQNEDGYLSRMVETTGKTIAKNLRTIAQNHYEETKRQ